MIAAELANLGHGRPKTGQDCTVSAEQAAALLNVSERSVKTAKAVKREAIPEVVELANLQHGQRADRVEGSIDLSTAAMLLNVTHSPGPTGAHRTGRPASTTRLDDPYHDDQRRQRASPAMRGLS